MKRDCPGNYGSDCCRCKIAISCNTCCYCHQPLDEEPEPLDVEVYEDDGSDENRED